MAEILTKQDTDNKIILTDEDIEQLRFTPSCVRLSEEESENLKNYDTKKCIEVIKYITQKLKEMNNNIDPTYYFVLKMLYLADKEHLKKHHIFMVPDRYVKMEYGPVPSFCYNIVKFVKENKNDPNFDNSIKTEFKVSKDDEVSVSKEINFDYLAPSNIDCLNEAINKYGKLEFDDLKILTHDKIYHSVTNWNGEITMFHIAKVLDELDGNGNLEKTLHEIYG